MRLIVLDIPDDPAALGGWLDRRLVGLDLAALVAELEAVHGRSPTGPDALARLLGDRQDEVLSQGLAALPAERLRTLLRRPRLLLDVQALILTDGGSYWQGLGSTAAEQRAIVERGAKRLASFLAPETKAQREQAEVLHLAQPPVAWHRRPWVVGLATAASILAIVVAVDQVRTSRHATVATTPWGWSRPEPLAGDVTSAVYLNRLADAAGEWFEMRPEDPTALAKRIAGFRQGCSVLILSKHKPLKDEDRTWLVEKCRAWAAKLDAHLVAIEAGSDPLQVRSETDETINALIKALRARARAAA